MSSGKNAALVIATLVVVLLIGAIIIKKSHRFTSSETSTPQQDIQNSATPSGQTASSSADSNEIQVAVNSDGFSPSSVTIKAGQTVTWTNTDNTTHAVYSNPHPTHTDYPPLNSVGEIQPGQKKSFTFTQAGTYKYHDHLFPENGGTVVVQ